MNSNLMQILKLNKRYKNFALKDVEINLPKGSIMGFVGPNGAGKSTTIKSILNIIPFDSGEILIDGMDSKKDEIKVKQIIGYVGEHLNLYGEVSADRFYKFVSKFYATWDNEFFLHLVRSFGLDLSKKIGTLSKGTAVKFALSLALSHHPRLIILDEPTSGLDPVVRNDVLELLQDTVANEKSSIFFSSHITEDVVKIADYVTYVNNGEVLLSDKKDSLLEKYKKVSFSSEVPEHLRHRLPLYRNKSAILSASGGPDYLNSIGLNDITLEWSPASLDDILLQLIKESKSNVKINH